MRKKFLVSCAIAASLMFQGCANTIKYDDQTATKAVESNLTTDQLKDTSLEMLENMLGDAEVSAAIKAKRPVLAVFGVIDFTADKVDLATINGHLYTELNKSNRFRFTNADELAKQSQSMEATLYDLVEDSQTAQGLAQSLNADYILVGEISNVIRTKPRNKQVFYRVSLKLLNSKKGEFVWQQSNELLKSEKAIVYGI